MNRDELSKQSQDVAHALALILAEMQRETGLPTEAILIGAHAEVVHLMGAHFGGHRAAGLCLDAASKVQHMPKPRAYPLAAGPTTPA